MDLDKLNLQIFKTVGLIFLGQITMIYAMRINEETILHLLIQIFGKICIYFFPMVGCY